MKIIFLADNYSTPEQPGLLRTWALSKQLSDEGHQVTVIAPSRHYLFNSLVADSQNLPRNLRLVDLRTAPVVRGRILSRLRYYAAQMLRGAVLVFRAGTSDIVVATLTPSMLGIGAYFVARVRGARFVLDERDLSLDAAAQYGLLPRSALRAAGAVERQLHMRSDALVAATPGLRGMLEARGIRPSQITVVPNGWVNLPMPSTEERSAARRRMGWADRTVMLYAGGLGQAYDLQVVMDALGGLGVAKTRLAILGEGENKETYRRRAERNGLDVQFLEPVPKNAVHGICNAADICVLALRAVPWSTCSLSTKLIDYMGAGRAVITTGPGDNADLVTRAEAGLVVPTADSAAMQRAMLTLLTEPQRREAMGQAARRFVVDHWKQENFSTIFSQLLTDISNRSDR